MSQPGVGPLTKGPINHVTKLELYPTFNGKQLVNAEQGATQPDLHFRKSILLQGGQGQEGPRSEAGRPVRSQLGACGCPAGGGTAAQII